MSTTTTEDPNSSTGAVSHQAASPGFFARLIARLRGREPTLRESIEDVIEEHREGLASLTREERVMLRNIVDLREREIEDVMVPRADIIALDVGTPFDELVGIFRDAAHSRLPVYREQLDDVIGMVHIKDVLAVMGNDARADNPPALVELKRRVLYVPPSMPVVDLLLRMRLSRIHMAIVIDEYGGVDGLVTIEDLIEQIVGDIEDEHDEPMLPLIMPRPNGGYEVDARALVSDLEKRLDLDLLPDDQDESVDTVGGLVFTLAGRVPAKGEVIDHPSGYEFEVIEADARRLNRVRIRPPKAQIEE